jgi:hypothetical protein
MPPSNRRTDFEHVLEIFSSPMRSGSPDLRFSDDPDSEETIHAAMIIFNLALTLHLQSLPQEDPTNLFLSLKAQAMYKYALKTLQRAVSGHLMAPRMSGNATFDVLVIAIMNNIAALHLDLGDTGAAQEELFEMLSYCHQNCVEHQTFESTPLIPPATLGQIHKIVLKASWFLLEGVVLTPSGAASAA